MRNKFIRRNYNNLLFGAENLKQKIYKIDYSKLPLNSPGLVLHLLLWTSSILIWGPNYMKYFIFM